MILKGQDGIVTQLTTSITAFATHFFIHFNLIHADATVLKIHAINASNFFFSSVYTPLVNMHWVLGSGCELNLEVVE